MPHPTEQELRERYSERQANLAERECQAWREYLATTRSDDPVRYEQAEPFAWRRLKRMLAELAGDRRRVEFEFDRALVEARGISKAS